METLKIKVLNPGTISEHFVFDLDKDTVKYGELSFSQDDPLHLIIEGDLDGDDVAFIRKLCGASDFYYRGRVLCFVQVLDLRDASFVYGGRSYFTTKSDYKGLTYYDTYPRTVSSYMFAFISGLHEIFLPKDTLRIDKLAFYRCSAKCVHIPETVKVLDINSFEGSGIETVRVNAAKIKSDSFKFCYNMKELYIGPDVEHINGAFENNINLASIELSPDNSHFVQQGKKMMNSDATHLVLYVQSEEETSLVIPEGVKRLCGGAIQGKPSLVNVELPQTLTYIGSNSLMLTLIEEIHIPANVTMISGVVFPRTLKHIYFHSQTPPKFKGQPFTSSKATFRFYVPKGCGEVYKKEFKMYADYIEETEIEGEVQVETKSTKPVKNRAFYTELKHEIRELAKINITDIGMTLSGGRFCGQTVYSVWKSNLFYIKWMVKLGIITDISDEVFQYLLKKHRMKHHAINNLKALLTVSQIKNAQKEEEQQRIKQEYEEFLAEQNSYRFNNDELIQAMKDFEDLMNDYDAWFNID